MKALSLFILCAFTSVASAELTIFDVRRTLRMSNSDPIYHDYYVNGGNEAGLSNGMVITVTRKLPLYDNYQNHSAGDLHLKVARIKIIHVQKGLSVARLQSEFTRENAPLLEDPFVMVGDSLDLSTATSGDKKNAEKDKESASEPESASEARGGVDGKPVAQITVNSVDLSSKSEPDPTPKEVAAPALQ